MSEITVNVVQTPDFCVGQLNAYRSLLQAVRDGVLIINTDAVPPKQAQEIRRELAYMDQMLKETMRFMFLPEYEGSAHFQLQREAA